jgi:RHS repeat-associated protein
VSVTPASATLYAGQSQQFTASIDDPGSKGETWTISPAVGTISSTGLYTAPATITTRQTVSVTATSKAEPAKSASATVTLMPKATTVITWVTPAAIIYGTALSAAQLDATANVAGTFVYSPATGTVLSAGTQTLSVAFTPSNTAEYNTAAATVTLEVNKATPVISWATPVAITYGTALSATQLDATANVAGTFVYTPSAGTVLEAGSQTLSASFTPTNTTDYNTAAASVTLTVDNPPVSVSVTPTTATLYAGQSQQFTASVSNHVGSRCGNDGVNWTISPAVGSISSTGLYTAPATITTEQTVTVTATSQANPANSASATVTLMPSVIISVTPASATLYAGQTQKFRVSVNNHDGSRCDKDEVIWTISPAVGSISSTGLYTAPATITVEQTVTVTATSKVNPAKSASATVTLMPKSTPVITWATPAAITYGTALGAAQLDATASVPGSFAYTPAAGAVLTAGPQTLSVVFTPTDTTDYSNATASVPLIVNNLPVSVTVTPTSATLNSGQTQQFTATVTNTSNTAVTWTIVPAGVGTIDSTGLYTAPVTISAQQTVTITATSQADTTQSASAAVTLTPTQCASNGYNYERAITIDHTQVPNTDQSNFPFLFNTTDPLLATTANGGHVTSPNGYDIIFTSDPAGQNVLNYEIEEYDPVHGQVIAWVQIPTLSHSTDTVIYLFYGNPSITASQQNPTAVWDSNYMGVWHVANNGGQLSLTDSTSNGNNATNNGATSTAGQIDGGMQTNGSTYATIGTPASLANLAQGNATFSVWVNTATYTGGGIMAKDSDGSAGWSLDLDYYNNVWFVIGGFNYYLVSSIPAGSGVWSYVTVALDQSAAQGGQATITINGSPSGTTTGVSGATGDDSTETAYLANDYNWGSLNGSADEFRISNVVRSTDWIATEYNNQGSPTAFYTVSTENVAINPVSATLYNSQSQQFTAAPLSSCYSSVTWSLSPNGAGTLTANGLYTAPANITTQLTVTITASSVGDPTKSGSVTVTLMPPVAVGVTPASATLSDGDQQQQFTASIIDTSNLSVTWTISPAGTGTIDATGLYTAPATIASQQTVTVTATSQFDPTKSASATITLVPTTLPPPVCASNGYSFTRAIVIDHTQVPNTDQANFPFLFNTTDPALATTANGGHVANFNGYDIFFASDPAGQNILNYEMEEYDPVHGQVIAWVRIPNLSHTTDTVLYMFYGNASIASPQQNPTAVWDANYMGVWHVANKNGQLSLIDSTSNGNNATNNGAISTAGQIDGGMLTNGSTYATIGSQTGLTNLAEGNATFSAWVNPTSNNGGTIIGNDDGNNGWSLGWTGYGWFNVGGDPEFGQGFDLSSLQPVNNGVWSYVTVTLDQSASQGGQATIYINGSPSGTGTGVDGQTSDDSYLFVSLAQGLTGSTDEFRISNIVRSPDWIATEYYNQSSPATFYQLYSENQTGVIPTTTSLYASQTTQFTDLATCGTTAVNWSIPASSPGMLTTGGLYTAPSSIATQQTVTVTASSLIDGSTMGTATIALLPPVAISIAPTTATVQSPQTQQFTATVANTSLTGVIWTISPSYLGSISQTGLFTPPGYSFETTVAVTATSLANPSVSATSIVTVIPPISISISPQYNSVLYSGMTQQFAATVANSSNTAVNWSISPATGAGTIDASGLYTAPSTLTPQQTVTITVTSQASPLATASTTLTLNPSIAVTVTVSPSNVTLLANQTAQFTSSYSIPVNSPCYGCSTSWSVSPAGMGTVNAYGLYTAPASIATEQMVTLTATYQGGIVSFSATATVTLIPNAPTISVSPQTITLTGGQSQQYLASVTNASSNAVTWSISPTGTGTLSATGLYTAPPVVSSQQVFTITASSQAIPTLTASATLTLVPADCAAKFYGYERSIVIDHTKVPDSDQPNFPFYFAVTDPLLATRANGGHMVSSSGYDIQFSTDPAGLKTLSYELEQYNQVTGQVVAWVQVPVLSHTQDTVIYMFYGNAAITASQQNPAGVWDSNYAAVYQFDNVQPGFVLDSTINGNEALGEGLQQATGEPGGAASFDGATSFIELPSNDFASYPVNGSSGAIFNASFGVWFRTSSFGVILGQTGGGLPGTHPNGWVPALYIDTNGYLRANFFDLQNAQQIVTPTTYSDNKWHYAVVTFDTDETTNSIGTFGISSVTSGVETLYVDGQAMGSQTGATPNGYSGSYSYFLGTGYVLYWPSTPPFLEENGDWFYFNGALDQVEISSSARSSDWVRTEYLNQSSPSAFFTLGSEAGANPSVNPLSVTLNGAQSQQFTVLATGLCNAGDAVWSMPAGSLGTLSPAGLYTAPETIATQQTVTLTATTLGASSTSLNATVTLMPPVAISVTPGVAALPAGGTQQFTATVTNTSNTGVTWTIYPAGVGSISATGLYTAPATLAGQQTVTATATSLADSTQWAAATITLGPAAVTAPAVSVNPPAVTLYANQTQQFTAVVTNTNNTAVTWSISPAGVGTFDNTGFYTAPATIAVQQTVTITATSVANTALSASATINLAPNACMANGYSYSRQIVIDHTKIPNTDQANFPFLFSTTDPLLATTANGGHVTNPNGYDIIFSTDPNGLSTLNYEVEEYNPATGQTVAWVQIPSLSHTSDTVIYLFYGNPSVTSSQQNPAAVWDSSYVGVWHLANGTVLDANDSTANANNGIASGVEASSGQIDGAASFNGTNASINVGSGSSLNLTSELTLSLWMNMNSWGSGWDAIVSKPYYSDQWTSPWQQFKLSRSGTSGNLQWGTNTGDIVSNTVISPSTWYNVVVTVSPSGGNNQQIFINGVLDNENSVPIPIGSVDTTPVYFGMSSPFSSDSLFNGTLDEIEISNIARSPDWIATEYGNQNLPSKFFTLSSEATTGIAPAAVTLYPNQSQQFAAPGLCSAGVTWSLSAGAIGILTSNGLYTAPSFITEQQTVTVTASSQAGSGQSASATVTLMPAISVTVSPASITLTQNQTQQFTANVSNSTNPAVTWTMSPAGLGSLDQSGAYIAPSSITTQQTVTITATSQTDPTKSASAMLTLAPSTCASAGYGYQRVIVIDHTKVANTDQINFPFLFNTTDPDLATVDNGGHVANLNGYDIIFSTDPNGLTKLDFEVEQYNPVTGQMVAWIRIPSLSHSSDTVIYAFYGNPAISASQANPNGVWDSNYQGVYHLGNLLSTDVAADSTYNANSAPFNLLTASSGQIDGAASLDGVDSYLEIPTTAFPSYPTGVYSNLGVNTAWNNTTFSATFGIWFKTNSWGGLLDQTAGQTCSSVFWWLFCSPELPGDGPYGSWGSMLDVNFNGNLEGRGVGPTTQTYNDGNWHFAAVTFENGVNKLYADGQLAASGQQVTYGYAPNYAYFVGTEDIETDTSSLDAQPWQYLNGDIDEINVSSMARSGDWIQTQYNNQSSPSTFYKFYSPSAIQVAPSAISLYAAQSEQFAVPGSCDASIVWSMPAGSPGTLSVAGLYTAPIPITGQRTVTVNAGSLSSGVNLGSAHVTLLPPPQPITLAASSPSPYSTGSSQTFTATLLDQQGNPQIGSAVSFDVAGVNAGAGSATTGSNGSASYTYTGANSGTDTIQATASINGVLLTSNEVTATWLTPPPVQSPAVMLLLQPSPGRGALVGAFTDDSGTVIEPISVGAAARTFIAPTGATRLQLGINDNYYEDNSGSGFVVAVNGANVPVPPTAMPWNWQTGGLNNNYQYGINDGSSPVVAAANLTAGETVMVAYQSGTVSTDFPARALVDANGETDFIPGTQLFQGTYFPTLYTTGTSYPQGQPVTVFAVVTDATGAPIPNAQVTLNVSGANPGQFLATSDFTGTAAFLYTGASTGNDSLQAQAAITGAGTLTSNLSAITWTNYPTPPPVGSLTLYELGSIVNSQSFSSFARDALGNPLPNENVGFYVTGVDTFQSSSTTNNIGQAQLNYYHTQSGNYNVIAVDSVGRNVIVTQPYTGSWVVPTIPPSASGGSISVSISANSYVAMPNALQLNGSATDSTGATPAVTWTQINGPGTVTFADPNQAVTTATFSQVGIYVMQLFATDGVNSGWAQFTVGVTPAPIVGTDQGWIGSPLFGSTVSGLVPITLAPGVSIQQIGATLGYAPANNPSNSTPLQITGYSGQIGTLDTTTLQNGSYWIQLQATNSNGEFEYSLVLVSVAGNYKPGRLTTTVTDLVVPATGLPINIQRAYDSLNASSSGDFGYGWNLGINVNLTVDPKNNVTFTLGGQRRTFFFTPSPVSWVMPFIFVSYTPEPGFHGTLTDSAPGCADGIDILAGDGFCIDGSPFNPPGYIYTDPNGTAYTIGAGGNLQSIQDRSGNGLTITPNGITSTTGLNVPFARDPKNNNRITQITDPQGNIYSYGYDDNGNLATVTYPNTATPNTYTYDANHYFISGTDARGNTLAITTYYGPTDLDPNGLPLNGRVQSGTDALGQTWTYTYDLVKNSMTVKFPPDASGNVGSETSVDDGYGMMLSYTNPLGYTSVYTYDANHNRISETDPLGRTTTYTYDSNGNTTSTTYPATATSKNTTSYTTYNQYSEPTSFTDELGNVRTYNYDANYNPQSATDSLGVVASFLVVANSTLQARATGYDITVQPGMATQYAYDANGNLTSSTDALGRTTSYTYDSLGHKLSMTVPPPNASTSAAASTTTYQYDALGNLLQTSAPLGNVTSSQYDANNNRILSTDARGYTTTYVYDALNRLIETDYPDGTKSTKTYDFRNNIVNSTDQNGNVTHNTYDLAGKLLSVTRGNGSSTPSTSSYTYYADGRKWTDTDPLSHTTTSIYDAAGRLITVTNAAGSTQYAYDDAGNQISVTDSNGNITQSQYDARKRQIKTIFSDTTFTTNTYDGPGNVISTTDQAGNVVQNTYDAANQLVSVAYLNSPNAPDNTSVYAYNADGNQTAMTDENGHTTQSTFDALSRLTSTILPDGSLTESRLYDLAGNLTSLTHFNGKTTTYTYDSLNRLTARTPDPSLNEPTVSFTYTPTGRRKTMTDGSGETQYTYDSLDRLTTKATPEGTLSYTYDAAGNVASIVSSNTNGISVSYTYDDIGRLSTVVDIRLQGNQKTTYAYDSDSNLVTAVYPNQSQSQPSTFAYDTLNRLSALSTPVSSYSYQMGPVGNRTSATEGTGRTLIWSYDGIYRLTNETVSNDPTNRDGSVIYSLDPVGNRKSATSTLSGVNTASFNYNTDDELTTERYDANGNAWSSGGNYFAYDSENELKSMNHGAVTIIYDGDGNRVAKTVNNITTNYLVDDVYPTGLPQVVEETVNGVVERQYTYGLGRISQNQLVNNTWTVSFYGVDGAGSVRQLTNSVGQVTDTYDYDAFGNKINSTGTTPNNYLYRGEQYDPDLSLYYLRARYYNPVTGRFLSVDPEAGQGQRRYEYADADPVDGLDPSGNEAIIEWALLRFYPSRLPFVSANFLCKILGVGCGQSSGSGGSGGSGGGTGAGGSGKGGPPPPHPPCHKRPPLADSPQNLALFPTEVAPNNYHIIYRLRTCDGLSTPNGSWYVFEHQTQKVNGGTQVGPGNTISPAIQDGINTFDDWVGGGGLNTVQSFTISDDPDYGCGNQYPVMIRYANGKDYLSQGIYQPYAADPVLINGYTQIPGWPLISGEF